MKFIEYPKCSNCKKAKKYLDDKNIDYIDRNIKENNPTYEEIEIWLEKYSIPINKLFNTSGLKYRELNLKEKLKYIKIYILKLKKKVEDGLKNNKNRK